MKKTKSIKITFTPRTKTSIPYFEYTGENIEKYEAIGLMELAIDHLKKRCLEDTRKNFNP